MSVLSSYFKILVYNKHRNLKEKLMNTLNQLKLLKQGLKLKDIFVLYLLKHFSTPTPLDLFLKSNPLIELNNKNLRLTLNKLENANKLTKIRTKYGLIFLFPFLSSLVI